MLDELFAREVLELQVVDPTLTHALSDRAQICFGNKANTAPTAVFRNQNTLFLTRVGSAAVHC